MSDHSRPFKQACEAGLKTGAKRGGGEKRQLWQSKSLLKLFKGISKALKRLYKACSEAFELKSGPVAGIYVSTFRAPMFTATLV